MNYGQVLSVLAVAVILGATVVVAVADPGNNTVVAEEKWKNTDIVDNVYPEYTECTLQDNFYAYVLNDVYAALSECADARAAVNGYNASMPQMRYYQETKSDINGVIDRCNELTGSDAGVVKLYRDLFLDAGSDADLALVESYVDEVMGMDTEQEFADFVATGGAGHYRSVFTTKYAFNSPFTGETAIMIEPGTLPWHLDGKTQLDDTAAANLENYKNVLEAYFADEPSVAATYYEDLAEASAVLKDASAQSYLHGTYSEHCSDYTNYPMYADLAVYGEAGVGDFTVTEARYMAALDGICAEDGYRYSRAIAMYAVLSDCAYRMGSDYVKLITGGSVGGGGVIYRHDQAGPIYGMLIGKYYTQLYGEEYRQIMEELTAAVIDSAGEYFNSLEWVSGATKQKIADKISSMVVRCCGPEGEQSDQYDYSEVADATCLVDLTSQMRAVNESVSVEQGLQERGEFWPSDLFPQTYNSFYSPVDNSINILAGYLVPRLAAATAKEAVCAEVLTVIGHEITHGFDSKGSRYDCQGKLDDGWMFTKGEKREYDGRIYDLIDAIDSIAVVDGRAHSGSLNNGEVTADMGGLAIVLNMVADIEGFDYDLFFRTFAQNFSLMYTHDAYVLEVLTDPHPSGLIRANLVLMQFQEFLDCYGLTEGDNMYPEKNVNPWRVS